MKRLFGLILAACFFLGGAALAQESDCAIVDIIVDKEKPGAGDRITVTIETDGSAVVSVEGEGIRFVEAQKEIGEAGSLYFAAVVLDEGFSIEVRAGNGITMVYEGGE